MSLSQVNLAIIMSLLQPIGGVCLVPSFSFISNHIFWTPTLEALRQSLKVAIVSSITFSKFWGGQKQVLQTALVG